LPIPDPEDTKQKLTDLGTKVKKMMKGTDKEK